MKSTRSTRCSRRTHCSCHSKAIESRCSKWTAWRTARRNSEARKRGIERMQWLCMACLALAAPLSGAATPQANLAEGATRRASAGAPPTQVINSRDLLNRYCVTCHNERLKTAGLMLDRADADHVGSSVELWEKVAHKLRNGAMPP